MTIDPAQIRQTVRTFILAEFLECEDPSALADTTPLITGGILDSIATIRLVNHLEQRFAIKLEQKDITVERLNTVMDISRTVGEKMKHHPMEETPHSPEGMR